MNYLTKYTYVPCAVLDRVVVNSLASPCRGGT